MIQTNISLEENQHKNIKDECFKLGYSLSFFIRLLVDEYFGKKISTNVSSQGKVLTEKNLNKIVDKIPKPRGVCKKCGAGLNEFGDFCLGKGHHKQ